ncbi:acyl-CoA carboxylase subunit epsilon [Streptomyces agglomeratus]|uniref:acyl-CoA carboxylase subunit epsilon n=1 Tax=Streptomyces agglomeratus TaxID=285458 RepID=UPI0008545DBD|nr:acyl-CoA carboxylase subunit epsilon [Streptomyces agglomeratus]OEJ36269.1 hypothetical protein BGK72_38545 [Streptomyces agglomeratus]
MTAVGSADDRTTLALASLRVTKGNPTAEEVAAIAALLTARLHLQAEAQAEQETVERVRKLPVRRPPRFIAPGAWAS